MKVRLEDLPPHARAQVLAQLKLLPVKPKEKSPRRKPVLVKAPAFCSRCGSYEHNKDSCAESLLDLARSTIQGSRYRAAFAVPIRTSNEQNQDMGKHWSVKSGKRSQVRAAIGRAWKSAGIKVRPRYRVTITRISAVLVDKRNLDGACKSVIDQCASELEVDDDTDLVDFVCKQEQGAQEKPAIRIEVEELP